MEKIKIVTESGDELFYDADKFRLNSNGNKLIFVLEEDYRVAFVASTDKVKWAGIVREGEDDGENAVRVSDQDR